MPATVPTTETFPAGTPEAQMKEAQRLRLKAGPQGSGTLD